MELYKKKEHFVKAQQFTGGRQNADEIVRYMGGTSGPHNARWVPARTPQKGTQWREHLVFDTIAGPREVLVGWWVVETHDAGYLPFKDDAFLKEFNRVEESDSDGILHARRELATLNADPVWVEHVMEVMRAFDNYAGDHSGGSHAVTVSVINQLLLRGNLSALTDDPEEWVQYNVLDDAPFWQNKRNGEAFSHDGGKTYYLLSEGASDQKREPIHQSVSHILEGEVEDGENAGDDLSRVQDGEAP